MVRQAEEAVRIEDALVLQRAIDAYTVDMGKAPHSLVDLGAAGYLKAKPERPLKVTHSSRKMVEHSLSKGTENDSPPDNHLSPAARPRICILLMVT
jgi:hypothetical protein